MAVQENFDPIFIVRTCRLAYKEFKNKVERNASADLTFKVEAAGQNQGYPGKWIIVRFGGPTHAGVWASSSIGKTESGEIVGIIHVNPELLKTVQEEMRRIVLAHEWIEVMLGFATNGDSPYHRSISDSNKIAMAIMYNGLARRTLWQDSPDEVLLMHAALRRLLVSEESLDGIMSQFASVFGGIKNLDELRELCESDANNAYQQIKLLCSLFSSQKNVGVKTVEDRVQEILFTETGSQVSV